MDNSKQPSLDGGLNKVSILANVTKTSSNDLLTPIAMPAPAFQIPTPRARRAPIVDPNEPTTRRSSRAVKRKKFDDEVVESSLIKTERAPGRPKSSVVPSALPTPPPVPLISPHTTISSVIDTSPIVNDFPAVTVPIVVSVASPQVSMTTSHSQTVVSRSNPEPVGLGFQDAFRKAIQKTEELKDQTKKLESNIVKPPAEKKIKVVNPGKTVSSAFRGPSGKFISKPLLPSKPSLPKSVLSRSLQSKHKSKRSGSSKSKLSCPAIKDLGRWKPQDDLALITAVQQTSDLDKVHTGVKFSCQFTLREIKERWHALLYDPAISKMAMEAARQLHSDTVASIQGKALYSNGEEQLLGSYGSTSQPTLDNFQSLLSANPDVFHPARTAKTLQCHWLLMKQYHLLPDQTVQPMPRGDHILNLSDIEDFINDDEPQEVVDEAVEHELTLADRRNKREIRHLEQEMPKWQVLVESVTGISMPDFDNQTLGVLRGRLVRYLMRSREISLGRATKDNHVDVDLSLEGPAWKVSRRQGIIKLRNSGEFFIANEGKRPILVDGKPVMTGNKQKLNNNSVVEISCLRFTFLMNMDVVNAIRSDASKTIAANLTSSVSAPV